jgi:hypothetical protein
MTHGTWLSPGLQLLATHTSVEGVNPLILQNLEYFAFEHCVARALPTGMTSRLRVLVRGPKGNLYA